MIDRLHGFLRHQARIVALFLAGLWIGALGFATSGQLAAQSTLQLPRPTGRVSDFAKVIAPEDEARITQLIEQVLAARAGRSRW